MNPRINAREYFTIRPLELAAWIVFAALVAGCIFYSRTASAPAETNTVARINLNAADVEELMTLPEMSRRQAQAIIKARAKRGGFKSVGELTSVPGLTDANVRRIEGMVEAK
ncbi:MAG TPA: helix-hairpin-helix domain-containing protein [Planctomycetota bacterium]|nr:helix-hairpin-helix domain-containing protein [Planctomycetota bacterium]